MNKLVIFGTGQLAEMAYFYFKNESAHSVCGFVVDPEYALQPTFLDSLPVVPSDLLEATYPPSEYLIFVAISYSGVNALRANKYKELKSLGYGFASFISSRATNYANSIGDNCLILEDNTIQPYSSVGNNVILWSGNHIGHHSCIEDHCFVASHVVISGGCRVGEYSFIGVNATLRDHITIGRSNVIGAGSLILNDTTDFSVFTADGANLSKVPSNRLRRI